MAEKRPAGLLTWKIDQDAAVASVVEADTAIPLEDWAVTPVVTEAGERGNVAPLLRRVEDGTLESRNSELPVSHPIIASLSDPEAASVGLPTTGDFSLEISSSDIITDPTCRLDLRLWNARGTPVPTFRRVGAFLNVGDRQYRCSSMQYQLLEAIAAFNEVEAGTAEKMRAWAAVSSQLPEEVRTDQYLRQTRVVYATSFSIDPYIAPDGTPDFNVVPGRVEPTVLEDGVTESSAFRPGLPGARQDEFNRRFDQFRNVHARYAAGSNWYVVLEKDVERVLRIARKAKDGTQEERRAFVRNPHAFLREALESGSRSGDVGDVDQRLDALFWDDGYSDRVAGIGLWEPKILPWLKASGQEWLPGEDLGVRIGDAYVQIEPGDLGDLRDRVEAAIQTGDASVDYKGTQLPATEDTLSALHQLVGIAQPDKKKKPEGEAEYSKNRIVLIVKENFESVEYESRTRPRGHSEPLPATLSKPLPHQGAALEWLRTHWTDGSPGALLADDMGLGKTFVALVFLAWVRHLGIEGVVPRKPMLTIGPTALLENWVAESEKHLGEGALGSTLIARGRALHEFKVDEAGVPTLKSGEIKAFDWVLTTYETWRDYQHSFSRIPWGVAIFDEVQKVKNPSAAVTDAAKAVNAEFSLALTGTPVENRLADLWCIVDLIQPGRLGALKQFSDRYERPIGEEGTTLDAIKSLRQTLESPPALLLRRLKENHLEGLPDRRDSHVRCSMPPVQARAYTDVVQQGKMATGRGHMLAILGQLRSISLHPGRVPDQPDSEFVNCSARLKRTFEILDSVARKREKALVFVESRDMQGELCGILQRRYELPGPPLIINGSVAGSKRQARVDEFQSRSGFDVMLLSPKAGGVGLTLTAANHVIHLSRWWNPAVEDQCTDRVYRIGQEREIHVYHPLAVHPEFGDASFDLRLDDLLTKRRQLSRAVLAPTAPTPEDLQSLFDDSVSRAQSERITESDLERIDLLEPTGFERWVMRQLTEGGYRVDRTPTTHDGGADVIARAPKASNKPSLILQCKHTQQDTALGPGPVDEVIRAAQRYELPGSVALGVVTNAKGFSAPARRLADEHDVRLVERSMLGSLLVYLS